MTGRRGLVVAVALVAAGGALAVVAAGRVWAEATLVAATGTPTQVHVDGHHVAAALSPLGVALLALAVAVVAARGRLRRLVGAVAAVAGAVVVAAAVAGHAGLADALVRRSFAVQAARVHPDVSVWWAVAVSSGLIAVAGGLLTVGFARGFPAMGTRYEAPVARGRGDRASATWDALDRGEDPTV